MREGLGIIMKNFSQDSQSPTQDLNPGPPKYEEGVLTTQLQHLVDAELALTNFQNANILTTMGGEVRLHHKLLRLIIIFTQT
jgi:hypothetical protein